MQFSTPFHASFQFLASPSEPHEQQRFCKHQRRGTSSINSSLTYFAHRFWAMAGHRSRSTARYSAKYIQHVIPGQVLGSAGCTLGTLERSLEAPRKLSAIWGGDRWCNLHRIESGTFRRWKGSWWIMQLNSLQPYFLAMLQRLIHLRR